MQRSNSLYCGDVEIRGHKTQVSITDRLQSSVAAGHVLFATMPWIESSSTFRGLLLILCSGFKYFET